MTARARSRTDERLGSRYRGIFSEKEVAVIKKLLAIVTIGVLGASCAREKSFDENYQAAKENAASASGASYDNAVGAAVQGVPGYMLSLRNCMVNHPGERALHGYLVIRSTTNYSVVLEPKGPLADCIADAMANRTLPAPPTTPYLNPLEIEGPPTN